jgi:tight adherence protein B
MGAFLGLALGLGLFLLVAPQRAFVVRRSPAAGPRGAAALLARAGVAGVGPRQLWAASAGCALLSFAVVLVLTQTLVLALAFAVLGAAGPRALVTRLATRRGTELRDVWPDVVDNLASAVRAGLSLPEALAALGTRGPAALRGAFAAFAADYRAGGAFVPSLELLAVRLADPVGDRLCAALRVTREVGGSDLGRLLRTLSAFLREDARVRGELETRQGWTVYAARLGLAAPWAVLLLLATQSSTIRAYDSPTGAAVLAGGATVGWVAYRLMLRIARLPDEPRVLLAATSPTAAPVEVPA